MHLSPEMWNEIDFAAQLRGMLDQEIAARIRHFVLAEDELILFGTDRNARRSAMRRYGHPPFRAGIRKYIKQVWRDN